MVNTTFVFRFETSKGTFISARTSALERWAAALCWASIMIRYPGVVYYSHECLEGSDGSHVQATPDYDDVAEERLEAARGRCRMEGLPVDF